MLIGSHLDVAKSQKKDLKPIKERLNKTMRQNKQILGSVFISPVTLEGIEELKETIIQVKKKISNYLSNYFNLFFF